MGESAVRSRAQARAAAGRGPAAEWAREKGADFVGSAAGRSEAAGGRVAGRRGPVCPPPCAGPGTSGSGGPREGACVARFAAAGAAPAWRRGAGASSESSAWPGFAAADAAPDPRPVTAAGPSRRLRRPLSPTRKVAATARTTRNSRVAEPAPRVSLTGGPARGGRTDGPGPPGPSWKGWARVRCPGPARQHRVGVTRIVATTAR